MYIHIASYDGKTLSLTRGPGPLLIGHYNSAAEWRIASSILAAVASRVPDSMVAVIADLSSDALPGPISGAGHWRHLSDHEFHDTGRGGWVWLEEGKRVLFVPQNRDEIEDCVYRTFSDGTFLIVPFELRRLSIALSDMEQELQEAALVVVDAAFFDIDVIINDESLTQMVLTRVSRIVAEFNQL